MLMNYFGLANVRGFLFDRDMRLNIKVKTNSKLAKIIEEGGVVEVHVNASPVDGEANEEVIELLADHFEVAKSSVEIIQGHTSKNKIVDIKIWQKRARRL